jgi:hypothetical protein
MVFFARDGRCGKSKVYNTFFITFFSNNYSRVKKNFIAQQYKEITALALYGTSNKTLKTKITKG